MSNMSARIRSRGCRRWPTVSRVIIRRRSSCLSARPDSEDTAFAKTRSYAWHLPATRHEIRLCAVAQSIQHNRTVRSARPRAAPTHPANGPGKPGNNNILPGGNIVQVAVAANEALGEFDYLLAAVGCLNDPATGTNPILNALSGDDRLTLFAPTDEAFENSSERRAR
jgi:uncharacterized surface protein with fasciclin (FAS1) repeats